jgi:thiosulfate dehydrogenase [quinone] large subunit
MMARAYGRYQLTALVTLRMLVGWHFFYEGLAKITNPYWTSAGYLQESQWWFSDHFIKLAATPWALTVADYANQWGLLLIGLALILGSLTRVAAVAGVVLLLLYYVAAPPLPGLSYGIPTEGSYLIVNKVLVELGALMVLLAFPTGHLVGLDRFIHLKRGKQGAGRDPATTEVTS